MNTNDTATVEQQRRRRKRINRMKNVIILTISIWMIASLVAIIILSAAVVHLNGKINRLSESVHSSQKNVMKETDTESVVNSKATDTQLEVNRYENVETGIDSADNKAENGDTHKVYLTFDSIPGENTDKILDVLKQYHVKATFFVTGDKSDGAKAVYKRIVKEGHTLGMHSFCNQYSTIYASTEAFEKDYNKLSAYLKKVTGEDSLYYRFPGGSSNQISNVNMAEFVHVLNEKNISYFDWNVSAGDTSGDYTVDDIVNNVTDGIENYKTSVVLLHDGEDKATTVEALGPMIEALQKMDASILPIDENTKVIQYIKADSVE
mgnify:FL=1